MPDCLGANWDSVVQLRLMAIMSPAIRGGEACVDHGESLADEPAHKASCWGFGRKKAGAVADELSGGKSAAADCAFHRRRPLSRSPIPGNEEAGKLGRLRRSKAVKPWSYGEGCARFLKDGALD